MAITEVTKDYVNGNDDSFKKAWDDEVKKKEEKLGRKLEKKEITKLLAEYAIKHSLDEAYEVKKFKEWEKGKKTEENSEK